VHSSLVPTAAEQVPLGVMMTCRRLHLILVLVYCFSLVLVYCFSLLHLLKTGFKNFNSPLREREEKGNQFYWSPWNKPEYAFFI
jgi:hypothetical protein